MDIYANASFRVPQGHTLQPEPTLLPESRLQTSFWLMSYLGSLVAIGVNSAKHPQRLVGRPPWKLGLREIITHTNLHEILEDPVNRTTFQDYGLAALGYYARSLRQRGDQPWISRYDGLFRGCRTKARQGLGQLTI